MKVEITQAYLQGVNGEEWVLGIDKPEPSSAVIDNTLFFPKEAIQAMWEKREDENYFYIRVIGEEVEPPHQTGCVCADCSGAELTSDND